RSRFHTRSDHPQCGRKRTRAGAVQWGSGVGGRREASGRDVPPGVDAGLAGAPALPGEIVSAPLKRVLFVCIGNACRSQMAEGFGRAYGRDIVIPASAGLGPASRVAPDTIEAMQEKGIDLRDHFPKSIRHLGRVEFDMVINMSGSILPENTFRC